VGPVRPARILVELICDLPAFYFKENFPDFILLFYLFRVPMVLMLLTVSMLSGLNIAVGKVLGEALASGVSFLSWLVLWIVICLVSCAVLMLYLLNLSMKVYRQIDVVPVYQSLDQLFWIISGLVLFNESQEYSW